MRELDSRDGEEKRWWLMFGGRCVGDGLVLKNGL